MKIRLLFACFLLSLGVMSGPSYTLAQSVTGIIGGASYNPTSNGECNVFGFTESPPLNLNAAERGGQALVYSDNSWFGITGTTISPFDRYIVKGVNDAILTRTSSTLMYTGSAADPGISSSIATQTPGPSNMIVLEPFQLIGGCGGIITNCQRGTVFSQALGLVASVNYTQFNNADNDISRNAVIGNTVYWVYRTSTGGGGFVFISVNISTATKISEIQTATSFSRPPQIVGAGGSPPRLYVGGGFTLAQVDAGDLSTIAVINNVFDFMDYIAVGDDAVYSSSPSVICRTAIATFSGCQQTYTWVVGDDTVNRGLMIDTVNRKLYAMRGDGIENSKLLRLNLDTLALEQRFSITAFTTNSSQNLAPSFDVPHQRITWIGNTAETPAQVNSIRVCNGFR